MADSSFDYPVFKILAANDTGEAPGHQGGVVIPREISGFFPELKGNTTEGSPTLDQEIEAQLYIGERAVGNVITRYQYQTWGGTRTPERRLTSNLGAVRDVARAGDILLFQRHLDNPQAMRLTLIKKDSREYQHIRQFAGLKRWGIADRQHVPANNADLGQARIELNRIESLAFAPFVDVVQKVETAGLRVARNIVFRNRVLELYGNCCSVTRKSLISPTGNVGIDAAHIVPLAGKGVDDPRNGLALSKEVHWAFDNGLFGVDGDRRILLPHVVKRDNRNGFLQSLEGLRIVEAMDKDKAASQIAFNWHRENILIKD